MGRKDLSKQPWGGVAAESTAETVMWPNRRYLDLVGIDHPIVQAPMAGANLGAMAIAVSRAGGLGSLPCGMLNVEQARAEINVIRQQTDRPINVNFFCHDLPKLDDAREHRWRDRLAPYYAEFGLDPTLPTGGGNRVPFDAAMCALMVEMRPRVVSFHYGLPERGLLESLKAAGCAIQSSATTVEEARWLEAHGADAIIVQGLEAGGHRGMFLARDLASQVGTFALVPQVVDAVQAPVVAAGGIADARGIVAALALGASAVQIGTGYLLCPEGKTSAPYRSAIRSTRDDSTMLTNVFSGRPARSIVNRLMREVGPISADAPPFPLAAATVQPLRTKAEAQGSGDFSPLLAGQAAALARDLGAGELTAALASEAQSLLTTLGR
jgi:nitronate monooxygenase